jgi:hypothetical protein
VAYVVAARWRAEEGCEDSSRARTESEHFAPPAHNYAIPELLEDRQLEFFTTFYDDRVGLAG